MIHYVKPGEGYWAIATKYGVDLSLLRHSNGDVTLWPGQPILVPEPVAIDPVGPPPVVEPPVEPSEWPDATNTGPTGTLAPHSGTYTVSTNNAVVQNLHITGKLYVNASNVTVRNCKITNTTNKYVVEIASGKTGLLIEDCEIDGKSYSTHGIVHGGYTLRRCNVHHCGDGLRIGSNTTVEDSWIHDLNHNLHYELSPHYDCIQSLGGTNMIIRHNTLDARYRSQTGAIIVSPYASGVRDVLIENNKMSGGNYTLWVLPPGGGTFGGGASVPYDPARPVTVRNNTFVRYSSRYGPLGDSNYPMKAQNYLVFSGNVFDTGGSVHPGMGYDLPPAK